MNSCANHNFNAHVLTNEINSRLRLRLQWPIMLPFRPIWHFWLPALNIYPPLDVDILLPCLDTSLMANWRFRVQHDMTSNSTYSKQQQKYEVNSSTYILVLHMFPIKIHSSSRMIFLPYIRSCCNVKGSSNSCCCWGRDFFWADDKRRIFVLPQHTALATKRLLTF